MANETQVTIAGNLTADPELRFTPSGAAVTNFNVASTPRVYNSTSNQWEDGPTMFLRCNVWNAMAENVAESLSKGSRVVVLGTLRMTEWKTKEGDKRTSFELTVDEVGASMKFSTLKLIKVDRSVPESPKAARAKR